MNVVKLNVPFYSNTSDNYHCFQASLRMILSYFLPEREYSWDELDRVTQHTSAYTWPLAGLLYCRSIGLSVKMIDLFDFTRFSNEGYSYLLEFLGREVADTQQKYSDLRQEMSNAREFVSKVNIEMRIPSRKDIHSALAAGNLVMCNVNARVLQQEDGYAGHFVVITGVSNDGPRLHDPGLPPLKDCDCSWNTFERAWMYPNAEAKNVMIFEGN